MGPMARTAFWKGDHEMAARIARAIERWDPKGEVAGRLKVETGEDEAAQLVATFKSVGDEQDATAYADGFADGYLACEDAEDAADEDEDEDEDEDSDEDDDDLAQLRRVLAVLPGLYDARRRCLDVELDDRLLDGVRG